MKGHLADQKQVLVFKAGEPGGNQGVMFSFPATGDLHDIHKNLLADGLAFHTRIGRWVMWLIKQRSDMEPKSMPEKDEPSSSAQTKKEPEDKPIVRKGMTHEEYMKALSENPRFQVRKGSGEGFAIGWPFPTKKP
jgi:hypothetical protein